MKFSAFRLLHLTALLGGMCFLYSCASSMRSKSWESALGPVPTSKMSPEDFYSKLRITQAFIPSGRYGRINNRPMEPRYITIHSTQNYTGDAYAHAKALRNGALRGGTIGYMCWHFTVQDDAVMQHLPTSERGEHADFDGPGNRYSIGIEMCEHKGNNLALTIDRTARLAASLMYHHQIPITHVVPHYHWPRRGYNPANKNCPHFLLEDGKPGKTWAWFLSRVQSHHRRIQASPSARPGTSLASREAAGQPFAPAPIPAPAEAGRVLLASHAIREED